MQNWLKWTLGLCGALVVAISAVILTFDWNWLRGPLTNMAASSSGREFRMGDLSGEWSLRPRFVLRDVHLGNAEWSKEAEMFSAETVEVVVDLRQLLRGRLVLPEIELEKPRLVLERQADGESNWSFTAEAATDAAKPESRDEMPIIGRLAITDGELIYRDPLAGLDLDSKVNTAVGSGGDGTSEVRLEGKGVLQGEPFTLRLTGGSLLMLREESEPYPLKIDLVAGPSRGTLSGSLVDPIKLEGFDIDVTLRGDNLARLSKMTGVPFPLTPSYDLKARLQREDKRWLLEDIRGTMGHSDLRGSVKIDAGGDRPFIEADLLSKNLDYRDVGSLIGIRPGDGEPEKPRVPQPPADKGASSSATPQSPPPSAGPRSTEARPAAKPAAPEKAKTSETSARRVLPNAKLAIEQVRGTDARIRFRGEKVLAPNVPLSGVDLTLEMKDGVLRLKPLSVGVAGGTTIADITIDARRAEVRTHYDIKLQGYELERFLAEAGLKDAGQGQIHGRILLRGTGNTIQSSLATADGSIRLIMDQGEISNLAMELVGLDVAESLGLWARGDRRVQIRCMAADLPVRGGEVSSQFFVLDTTDTTVNIVGTANLGDEQLDLRIMAEPKDPSPLSARTPITITGAFAKPSVGVATGPLAARAAAAAALGIFLTPLASLLAFLEPGLAENSDCGKLLREAKPN